MKTILIRAVVLATSLSSFAAERAALVNPQPSVFRPVDVRVQQGHFAKFTGVTRIDGTLYIDWSGVNPPIPEYRLIPTIRSSKNLPHFGGYRVTWIEPQDGSETLLGAVDAATYARVVSDKAKFNVTGSWWVSDYEVGVECDAPYAHARIRFIKAPDVRAALTKRPETC